MGEEKKKPNYVNQAIRQIGAGGSAGFVEVCIMHPLDLIKTRLQMQRIPSGKVVSHTEMHLYSGIRDCFRKMYQSEGLFAFWKGVIPPIVAETPKRAVKFFTFEQYQQFFRFGSPVSTPVTFCLAGLCAGITEAILVNPFEVVKVTLQVNRSQTTQSPSTWSVTREIVRTQGLGLNGLMKGLTATVARNGAFNMVYFGFYHSVKGLMPQVKGSWQEFFKNCGCGFVSGSLASCVNIPFDVAKSRIQGPQPTPGVVTYKGTIRTMQMVYSQEGFRALYKGLLPKVMRLGPGGAIMLVVYEHAHAYLTEVFPD
ncbi:Mitochondrial 2-oxodicarboxylate carrier [Frankliniella fusca]|uniref:Mitochondrial 2-oxodicarboxylate carrier n=1 Tax=Frankliniella fusca TaxID=407009 RepID=A0AAE1HIC0_9NEOP|nr:Mitochondrial 2-oxodicarboxylate carrier [Frankliniella fusca]